MQALGSRPLQARRIALVITIALVLTGCASRPGDRRTTSENAPQLPRPASAATWTADLTSPATSTVPAPRLPAFPQQQLFVVGFDGSGKALASFVAPAPDPSRPRWHRVAKFIVGGGLVDGVWVAGLSFWGRLGYDTVVTAREETGLGSNKFVTVSRRVRDILRGNPTWRGFEDKTRVSVTFKGKGNSPVDVLTITALDPIRKTIRLLDPGPHYTQSTATDPVVRNALIKLDGTSASIVGYLVYYPGNAPLTVLVVDKDGNLFRTVDAWDVETFPPGPEVLPRAQPESTREAAVRRNAVATGARSVNLSTGIVQSYLVRVVRQDGTSTDVLVGNDAQLAGSAVPVKLVPWNPQAR